MSLCVIKEIRKNSITIRLFNEEIEEAEFVCLALDVSYEQFFVTAIKNELKTISRGKNLELEV